MKLKHILFIITILCIAGCGSKKSSKDNLDIKSVYEEGSAENNVEISEESINTIIQSIPSPVEMATVIKKSGIDFNEDLLNPQNNASLYTTDEAKALNLGIYSGDLGYINIYEKVFITVNYLNIIKKLADDIKIGQFFDFETIKRLASNSDKIDSLIYLSTINFNRIDQFLRNQKRTNMSLLLVTGTWIEGLYIATKNYEAGKNQNVMEWIGYQKIIINQLILGLSAFKNDSYIQGIVKDITSLKTIYDTINITYEYHEPESVEVDGKLVIVDKSTSRVDITPEKAAQICTCLEQIRSRLVKNM